MEHGERELFVFAGQSNMMGAAVFPPTRRVFVRDSYEYKHKPRRLGAPSGCFVPAAHPAGEFSYADTARAYAPDMVDARGASRLSDYAANTYFCPALSSLASAEAHTEYPFSTFSESFAPPGVSLAPLFAEEWEKTGRVSAYAHIAKGSVHLSHYFTDDMAAAYARRITDLNRLHGTHLPAEIPTHRRMPGAADYFFLKCRDFFADAAAHFPGETFPHRCFLWLQGEGDANGTAAEYETGLDVLWEALRRVGFTLFCCLRVDYFGNPSIDRVMAAQEAFVAKRDDAVMLTRAASYFPYDADGAGTRGFWDSPPDAAYANCRDSFRGFSNRHINEAGFALLAQRGARNLYRVLVEGRAPLLEAEHVRSLREPHP